jgi:hypothetical protein
MTVETTVPKMLAGDEEAFAWATASLGEARRDGKYKTVALLEPIVAELAFDLGANVCPPEGTRAASIDGENGTRALRT